VSVPVQDRHRGAQVGVGGVVELDDQGVTFERGLHDPALDPFAAAVNEPDLPQACVVRSRHVLLDNRADIARVERVKVQLRLNRDVVWLHGRVLIFRLNADAT